MPEQLRELFLLNLNQLGKKKEFTVEFISSSLAEGWRYLLCNRSQTVAEYISSSTYYIGSDWQLLSGVSSINPERIEQKI